MPSGTSRFWTILCSILIKRPSNMDFFLLMELMDLTHCFLLHLVIRNTDIYGFVGGYTVSASDFYGLHSNNVIS